MSTPARRTRALVLHDHPDEAEHLMAELWRAGCAAEWTRAATRAALEDALASPWELVISDYRLRELSALEALERVRARGCDAPFVIVSSSIGEERAIEAIKAGAQDFVLRERVWRLGAVVERELDLTEQRRTRARELRDHDGWQRDSEALVGMLGHDLRNPLAAIITGASVLVQMVPDSPKVATTAARIRRSADRMRLMIDQLLDFTRVRMGGGLPLAAAAMNLADACRAAIDESAGGADVRLEVLGEPQGVWDRARLVQAVACLVGNAVRHASAGAGVHVRLDGRDPATVALSVHDDGVIPPDVQATVFEPQHTTGRPRSPRSSGLGLGLFLAREAAHAHGGRIELRSAPDQGTTFTIVVPRHAR